MTDPICGRAWEASAIEDGRLDTPSQESFQRHVDTCAACQKEVRALQLLRDLRLPPESGRVSPLEHRRMRQKLLKAAHSASPVSAKRSKRRTALVAAACVGCAAMALAAMREFRSVPGRPETHRTTTVLAPRYEAESVNDAVWGEEQRGPSTRIVLSAGTLSVHVKTLGPGQRFVLALPDGELEVRGTRFVVTVSNGHTERVGVTEGTVALRLANMATRTIGPAAGWERDTAKSKVQEVRPPEAVPQTRTLPSQNEVSSPETERRHALPREGDAKAATERHEGLRQDRDGLVSAEVPTNAAKEFVTAMSAFSSGAYVEADEYFAAFAARFGADSRVEDAVYLRTVIALRRGDRDAAAVRARDYLNRFPHGLRRIELEKLVSPPESAPIVP